MTYLMVALIGLRVTVIVNGTFALPLAFLPLLEAASGDNAVMLVEGVPST